VDRQVPELRRYSRVAIDVPAELLVKRSGERLKGITRDISLGGMQLQIQPLVAFGEEIEIYVALPGQKVACVLPAVVRWGRGDVLGAQFRLLGARETYAITELTKER
jgi:hypothetical protein